MITNLSRFISVDRRTPALIAHTSRFIAQSPFGRELKQSESPSHVFRPPSRRSSLQVYGDETEDGNSEVIAWKR